MYQTSLLSHSSIFLISPSQHIGGGQKLKKKTRLSCQLQFFCRKKLIFASCVWYTSIAHACKRTGCPSYLVWVTVPGFRVSVGVIFTQGTFFWVCSFISPPQLRERQLAKIDEQQGEWMLTKRTLCETKMTAATAGGGVMTPVTTAIAVLVQKKGRWAGLWV